MQIDILDGSGHRTAIFEDLDDPEKRKELANEVNGLRQKGYACFLKQGDEEFMITGYDMFSNTWYTAVKNLPVVVADKAKKTQNLPAVASDKLTAVPRIAGG